MELAAISNGAAIAKTIAAPYAPLQLMTTGFSLPKHALLCTLGWLDHALLWQWQCMSKRLPMVACASYTSTINTLLMQHMACTMSDGIYVTDSDCPLR